MRRTRLETQALDKIEIVRQELVEMELAALRSVIDSWCDARIVSRRKNEWEGKLPAFRTAISKDMENGKESWPRELVLSEHYVAQESVNIVFRECPKDEFKEIWARRNHLTFQLPKVGGGIVAFKRPFPAPKSYSRKSKKNPQGEKLFINWRRAPHNLTNEIVKCRLGLSETKVRDPLKGPRETAMKMRFKPSAIQSHLASTFLDLCSTRRHKGNLDLAKRVFGALQDSGFNELGLYYLIQIGHYIDYPLVAAPHNADEVEKLCSAACR